MVYGIKRSKVARVYINHLGTVATKWAAGDCEKHQEASKRLSSVSFPCPALPFFPQNTYPRSGEQTPTRAPSVHPKVGGLSSFFIARECATRRAFSNADLTRACEG